MSQHHRNRIVGTAGGGIKRTSTPSAAQIAASLHRQRLPGSGVPTPTAATPPGVGSTRCNRVQRSSQQPRRADLKCPEGITGAGRLVFLGTRTVQRPISENTLNAALRRLGYTQDEVTSHGFRATASTLLNESGRFSPDAIERALAHQDADTVRRAYARGAYWAERVEMAQWWSDYLDRLKTSKTIVSFSKRA